MRFPFAIADSAHVAGRRLLTRNDLSEEVRGQMIAERATALGGLALGTVRLSAASSQLPEYDLEVTDSLATVNAVAERYAALAANMRQAIEPAEAQGERVADAQAADPVVLR